jgi:hypothetical protein
VNEAGQQAAITLHARQIEKNRKIHLATTLRSGVWQKPKSMAQHQESSFE